MAFAVKRTRHAAWLAAVIACGLAGPAVAHSHVLVTAKAEIVFDAQGRMTGVRNIWQFDAAFSAFASQGLDADGDGKLSDAELALLAKVNVDSLQEYDFFTYLTVDNKLQKFDPPKEYWLEPYNGQLTLFFTLPLKERTERSTISSRSSRLWGRLTEFSGSATRMRASRSVFCASRSTNMGGYDRAQSVRASAS